MPLPDMTRGLMDPQVPSVPAAPRLRRFDDIDGQREDIYNGALEALRGFKPVENATHRIELADVDYDGPFTPTKADEKRALLEGVSLHRPIRGTVRLVDKETGNPLDERRVTLARVPHLNSRGLFIRNGVVWSLRNQARLRPGAYTRRRADGATETHFNIRPGTGRGFRLMLEPETGLMKVQVGQSTTRLYPLLRQLGVPDEQLREAWGDELFEKNYRAPSGNDANDLRKLVTKLGSQGVQVDEDQLPQAMRDILTRAELDPDTTELTLGERVTNLSPEILVRATRKVLQVARQEADEDNRDSQAFQSIHGAEDFIRERLSRDQAGALRKVLWRAAREGKLPNISTGLLDKNIGSIFEGSGLAQTVEDINPFETYDQRQAVTRLGEGGISSTQSVSRDARGVQSSYLGVIDAGRGPECFDGETEVFTHRGWVKWSDITVLDEIAVRCGSGLGFERPLRVIAQRYCGRMLGYRGKFIDYLVTPNHRMRVQPERSDRWRFSLAEEIHGAYRRVDTAPGVYAGVPATSFTLPVIERTSNRQRQFGSIDINDWAAFFGWYTSEGSCYGSVTSISQSEEANPKHCSVIRELLQRLPFAWSYCRKASAFSVCGIQLVKYLRQFGDSHSKYLPEEVHDWPVSARQALLDALLLGDGRKVLGRSGAKRTGAKLAYLTVSKRLATDVERLAIGLGYSTHFSEEPDAREHVKTMNYRVSLLRHSTRVLNRFTGKGTHEWYEREWDDYVYCAEVTGGQLFVRRNGCVPFWTGNSTNLGLDLRVTDAAMKGSDNQLYTTVLNPKTGETEKVSARTLSQRVVAFPGELDRQSARRVIAVKNGKMQYVNKDEVDYAIPDPNDLLSRATAMIPFPQSIKGQRLLMGARFTQQAMPLREPEAPLVQTAGVDGTSLHKAMGQAVGAAYAPVEGVVVGVTGDEVKIRTRDGSTKVVDLYNNYPSARKTMIHNTPLVQRGQVVRPGDLIAKSNYTDDTGTAAIGRNLRVAFMAAEGDTIEDAFVISESAAKKLTSEALYRSDLELSDVDTTKKSDYKAVYSDKYTTEQYDKIDDDGVIRVGAEVRTGDPLILGFGRKDPKAVGALMSTPRSQTTDRSQTWEHHAPGVVTDVARTRTGVKVTVKSYDAMNAADKLASRFGSKGVISAIRPDEQMPVTKDGQPVEVITNAFGIISRTNPGALAEALLGRVARKRGEPYAIKGFGTDDVTEFALQEALKHGVISQDPETGEIRDTEDLTDPRDGSRIPNVFVGESYFMKLHHMAESKLGARDVAGYTTEGLPARGGSEGSKRVGILDTYSLLSAGATDFLRDAKLVRGQRNDDYWRALRMGETPMAPDKAFANEHFKDMLRAAGVNIREEGTRSQLSPMLDEDVDKLAEHEIQNPGTFDFETMRPVKGGLFDLQSTGGAGGGRFSKITLPAPVPHPLFVEPIQRLLGVTGKKLQAVMRGEEKLGNSTGPQAIMDALKSIDIDKEINFAKEAIRSGRKTYRDQAVKKLNYLAGLKSTGVRPDQLMVTKIPVIPPKYRPIVTARGMDMVHDLNYLYHDLLEARENYKEAQETFGDAGDEYVTMAETLQAISGVRDPVNPKTAEQGVKGVLRYAIGIGDTPKAAAFQRKVLGSAVDTVGIGVITADKSLDMDQVGVPKAMAFKIFRPYIIRRLTRQGMPATEAVEAVRNEEPVARKALEAEMRERPVVYNRAPALHRYAYVGAWGKIRDDDAIGLPYHTLKGIGGDYDGDRINIHVPSTEDAVKDAKEKLMPSKNLFFTGDFETHLEPVQDYLAGLYLASSPNTKEPVRTFVNETEARRAFARGEINARTPIRILDQ